MYGNYVYGTVTVNSISFLFQIDVVCHGDTPVSPDEDGSDPYAEPKSQGKFRVVASGNALTTEKLVQRIVARRLDYEDRNAKKEAKEIAAYQALVRQKKEKAAAGDAGITAAN